MKKKIVSVAIVAAVAVAAAWGFNQSKNEMALSDVALNNVEALAQSESGSYAECYLYGCRFAYNYTCTVYSGWGIHLTTCSDYRG